jgi:D-alanyl-lipoteichoic acid acyltransferase DltB (MBOAT superfamily)
MWGLAFLMFFACKCASWLTLSPACRAEQGKRGLYFLFGYPGMNPEEFIRPSTRRPAAREWLLSLLKMLIGVILLWKVCRTFYPAHPLPAAWTGMVGLVLVIHFGLFHLVALIWQQAGFGAQPIMRSPLKAESLSDFWSGRWNLAFHFLASRFLYLPLRNQFGGRTALLATFLASGLIHELVITVPAQSGYGLPTLYFLLQGAGIVLSQGKLGRRMHLRKGPAARAFAWGVTLLPVCCLFPQGFIQNVMLPFLKEIKAL